MIEWGPNIYHSAAWVWYVIQKLYTTTGLFDRKCTVQLVQELFWQYRSGQRSCRVTVMWCLTKISSVDLRVENIIGNATINRN